VQRSSVVSVQSNPIRHSSFGSAHENPGAGKKTEQIFPSTEAGDYQLSISLLARHQGCILYQYGKAKEKKLVIFFVIK
jgi:hypothetical protein